MTQLVETMLNLARVEQSGPSGLDTVDLNALLQSVVTQSRAVCRRTARGSVLCRPCQRRSTDTR